MRSGKGDGREFRKGKIITDAFNQRVERGYNPKTGAKEGIIEFIPKNGDRPYAAGEIYPGRFGNLKLYGDGTVKEINTETFNLYYKAYEKKEKEVQALTQKFLIGSDQLFIHFMGENNYKLLRGGAKATTGIRGEAPGFQELKRRMEFDGYNDDLLNDEMLNAEARPQYLRLLDPKKEDFALGVLKLSWVIRTSDFVFDKEVEDDLIADPTETDNLFSQVPTSAKCPDASRL